MADPFPIIEVQHHAPSSLETMGTKAKFWYQNQSARLLFKIAREGTGEDWAEKVASELCKLLSIPHAEYDLAYWEHPERGTLRGVVTCSFVSEGWEMVHGNELLGEMSPDYPMGSEVRKYNQSQHTVEAVLQVVGRDDLGLPPGEVLEGIVSPVGAFLGYLMLDAWIANQDRHHENWACLRRGSEMLLAPTFDHASSLGRNESDEKRERRLAANDPRFDVTAYAAKARSALFFAQGDHKPLSPCDAFREAGRYNQEAVEVWLAALESVEEASIHEIFERVPESHISEIAIEFAECLLRVNRERLLQLRGNL